MRIDELYSQGEVNGLEQELDKMFMSLGLDVEFTPHFIERMLGREKKVTYAEMLDAFEKLKKKYKGKLLKAKKNDMGRATLQDLDQDLNVVFAIVPDKKNNEYDLVNITAMTKDPDQFHLKTSTPLKVGSKKPVTEESAFGELERDIATLWLKIETTINDRFEGGWATCTYACREVVNLSKHYDMVVADGEYNGEAHWFVIVNTGDGKKIVDLGNNIDDKHMDSGKIEPMIIHYPDSRYQVDETFAPDEWVSNIYPEIRNF